MQLAYSEILKQKIYAIIEKEKFPLPVIPDERMTYIQIGWEEAQKLMLKKIKELDW